MRVLSIDYGDSRVGLAVSDQLGITAQGLKTIKKISDKQILKELEEIISKYQVKKIIIGMPYHLDGGENERTRVTNEFIHKLKCKFNKIPLETIDERLTTVEAHRTMNFLEIDNRKKRNIVDTLAAIYILEIYLKKINKK